MGVAFLSLTSAENKLSIIVTIPRGIVLGAIGGKELFGV